MADLLYYVLAALVLVVSGTLIYAWTQPDTFQTQRSLDIGAPPEKLHGLISDLRVMNSWNPFVLRAPEQNGRYSGPAGGPGAKYDFDGKKSGTGWVEVVGGEFPRSVQMQLVMTKPMACDNQINFTLVPIGDKTRVTWTMSGQSKFLHKLIGLLMCSSKMVEDAFDEGLAKLKSIAERK